MKKAAVMRATFVPYRPFLPIRNIAIALGDNTKERNISIIPPSRTHRDRSDSSSKARLMAPPNIIANTPETPSMRLQNDDDAKVVFMTAKYFSSCESDCCAT